MEEILKGQPVCAFMIEPVEEEAAVYQVLLQADICLVPDISALIIIRIPQDIETIVGACCEGVQEMEIEAK